MRRRGGFRNPEPLLCIAIIGIAIGIFLPWARRDGLIGWAALCILVAVLAPFVFYLAVCTCGTMVDWIGTLGNRGDLKHRTDRDSKSGG
jgi:hypothetical protein